MILFLPLAKNYDTSVNASRLGSLMDLVIDGENGIHFESGNSDDLAMYNSKLLKDDDLKQNSAIMGES